MLQLIPEEELFKKSPQELTSLLYDHLIDRLELSIDAINTKDFSTANQHLQKCNDILVRLGVGINYEAGIVADQLDTVYNYIADKLIVANLKKDTNIIQEVLYLIRLIAEAWKITLEKGEAQAIPLQKQKSLVYEKEYN